MNTMRLKKIALGFTAFMMLSAFVLCSCSKLVENNETGDLPQVQEQDHELAPQKRTITPALYLVDSARGRLTAQTKELNIKPDQKEAVVIVEVIVKSMAESITADIAVKKVEVSEEVANVYLDAVYPLEDKFTFYLSVAITNTLADYLNVAYVCVFVNGSVLTIDGYPCGALRKSGVNVAELYNEYMAKYSPKSLIDKNEYQMDVMLYFADETYQYILPEARKITFKYAEDQNEFLRLNIGTILQELAKGPKNKSHLRACISKNALLTDEIPVTYGENKNLVIHFASNALTNAAGGKDIDTSLATASVFYTLAGVFDASRVTSISGNSFIRSSYMRSQKYLGSTIKLYFPEKSGYALRAVNRVVSEEDSHSLETYVRELIRGPLNIDEGVRECVTMGMVEEDLLGIELYGSLAAINFSQSFANFAGHMSEESKRSMYYSMINTICSVSYIKSVQFLIEWQKVDNLGDRISIRYPLMPNYGLVK